MYCDNCGKFLEEGMTFCASCGAPVAQVGQAAQATQPQQPYVQNTQPQQPYMQNTQPYVQGAQPQGYQQPAPYQYANYGMNNASPNTPVIYSFMEEAKKLRVLGIAAAILMFGIGFIFSIIILVKAKKLGEPVLNNPTPAEIAELEKAKKVLKTAKILSYLPFIVIALSFVTGFIQGLAGV